MVRSKKSQLKKVVREVPVADGGASSSDPWAWRKYGQKPIKGSPYPRYVPTFDPASNSPYLSTYDRASTVAAGHSFSG